MYLFTVRVSQKAAQVAEGGCGVCVLENARNSTGHNPKQPTVSDPAWTGGLHQILGTLRSFLATAVLRVWAFSPRNLQRCSALLVCEDFNARLSLSYFRPCRAAASVKSLIIHLEWWPYVSRWHSLHMPPEILLTSKQLWTLSRFSVSSLPHSYSKLLLTVVSNPMSLALPPEALIGGDN